MAPRQGTRRRSHTADDAPGSAAGKPVAFTDPAEILREEGGVTVEAPVVYSRKSQSEKEFDAEEIEKHNTREDCWLVVDGVVYDTTEFVDAHPGGWTTMMNCAGRDATDAFAQFHPNHVYKTMLPRYRIGVLSKGDREKYAPDAFVRDMRALRQRLLSEGKFKTDSFFYVKTISWLFGLLALGLGLGYASDGGAQTWAVVGSAVVTGLFWQQLAFVGHDVGHNSVSHVHKLDAYWGAFFGNAAGGIALGWWKDNHNTHHVVCNSIEHDPDIQHMPFFAVDERILGKYWSTYYEKYFTTDFVARTTVSYQHLLFYPVMALARINLYVKSYEHLVVNTHKYGPHRRMQLASLAVFALWVGGFLATAFSDAKTRLGWFLLSHAVAGVLHVQICISHFPMYVFRGRAYAWGEPEASWYRLQLKTSLDVDCHPWLDWFHGGLQFQVEHHLFPRVPRHNLRYLRTLLKEVCAKHEVEYHEATFVECNKMLLSCMKDVGMKARQTTKGDGGFYSSQIYDGMHLIG